MKDFRKDFPILKRSVNNRDLIYFDNAATTQKPNVVIDAISDYYKNLNSNIHRGTHFLSNESTDLFESARINIQKFINAKLSQEIIFTRGTTEGINLIASSFSKQFIGKGDEIILSGLEHHSNIVPWQLAAEEKGAKIVVLPINMKGEVEIDKLPTLINDRTRIIAISHVSNSLGTINPIKKIIEIAHSKDVPVLIDAAQSVSHIPIDVQELDCDFLCFSGHKLYAPMGIGIAYGKKELLDKMPPYQGGGEMIDKVTFEKTTFNELPFKFEAGTPSVADVIGLDVAIKYVLEIGFETISEIENSLLHYATEKIKEIDGIRIIGEAENKTSVLSFLVDNVHPYDIGTILDKFGIAVRTGHHCTQPVMDFFGIPGTIRASFSFYNTKEEIDVFIEALKKSIAMFV